MDVMVSWYSWPEVASSCMLSFKSLVYWFSDAYWGSKNKAKKVKRGN